MLGWTPRAVWQWRKRCKYLRKVVTVECFLIFIIWPSLFWQRRELFMQAISRSECWLSSSSLTSLFPPSVHVYTTNAKAEC